MKKSLSPGDLVEVRSKEEILATLDEKGCLRGLPFMPEMFEYCGRQLRVYKRAHKTCDTAINHGTARWLGEAVLLEGIRCNGSGHGGCNAECLIFWWNEWLKDPSEAGVKGARGAGVAACTEAGVASAAVRETDEKGEPVYACQATQLPYATTFLPWWDIRQYAEDYTSGNVNLWTVVCGLFFVMFFHCSKVPVVKKAAVGVYDAFQALIGGVKFPRKRGAIPAGQKTPTGVLNLQPGELVRVKSYEDILATINQDNKNQGLYFDAELVPYCGKVFRVFRRISRVIDERTGKMIKFKHDSIMLENVVCQGRYSNNRMFCPRAMPCFWREIWLERVEGAEAERALGGAGAGCAGGAKGVELTCSAARA